MPLHVHAASTKNSDIATWYIPILTAPNCCDKNILKKKLSTRDATANNDTVATALISDLIIQDIAGCPKICILAPTKRLSKTVPKLLVLQLQANYTAVIAVCQVKPK
jgi:hypothetical protein